MTHGECPVHNTRPAARREAQGTPTHGENEQHTKQTHTPCTRPRRLSKPAQKGGAARCATVHIAPPAQRPAERGEEEEAGEAKGAEAYDRGALLPLCVCCRRPSCKLPAVCGDEKKRGEATGVAAATGLCACSHMLDSTHKHTQTRTKTRRRAASQAQRGRTGGRGDRGAGTKHPSLCLCRCCCCCCCLTLLRTAALLLPAALLAPGAARGPSRPADLQPATRSGRAAR